MNTTWDLTVFYPSFDDPKFKADLASLPEKMDELMRAASDAKDAASLERVIALIEALPMDRLGQMIQLHLAADADDPAANAALPQLMRAGVSFGMAASALTRSVAKMDDLEAVIASSEVLTQNAFALREMKQSAAHLLPEALEEPILRMQLSGGEAFAQLRDKLTAGLTADYRGEAIPLSAVRALAYDADASVRRDAYDAELASYKKIDTAMAACLNNIKAEGETMAKLKGYDGILSMTLDQSRMERATIDAMFAAIGEVLPDLRLYFKAKGKLLGHENGLPFYDLFAPVGEDSRTYTIEEARDLLVELFTGFSPAMGAMMAEAFDSRWIDFLPRTGKAGGAFCAGFHEVDISRILTNFTGSLSDVSTLAHELGHAFNNRMLFPMPLLMKETPMPLAETASTFNEVLLSGALRKSAGEAEELRLLDANLVENTQTLVDIYSRYLFETAVVAAQADHPLSVDELNAAMLDAQDKTYGDGLDPDFRHPYMWACKSHYYSTGMHFYNFPYAFGNLFAHGLYARYLKEGDAFVPQYETLLSRFGSGRVEDICAEAGIDVRSPAFWREACQTIAAEARRFAELAARA